MRTDLQPAGPADQPRRRPAAGDRRVRAAASSRPWPGALGELGTERRAGGLQRGRLRRVQRLGRDPRGRGRRGLAAPLLGHARVVGLERAADGAVARGHARRRTPAVAALGARGRRRGPSATLTVLNAGAAIYAAGRAPDRSRPAPRRAEEAIDSGAATRRAGAIRGAHEEGGVSIRLEELVVGDPALGGATQGRGAARRARAAGRRRARASRPFAEALSRPGTSVIAEHKRRSPSAGRDPRGRHAARSWCGPTSAAAPRRCRSSPRRRTSAAHSTTCARRARPPTLPILRKDFTVDPYQLFEAKAAGGDAVLVVVGSAPARELAESAGPGGRARPRRAGGDPPRRRARGGARARRGRHRDQQPRPGGFQRGPATAPTTSWPTSRRARRSSRSPASRPASRSRSSRRVGVDAVLVGETLMRAPDPEAATRELAGDEEQQQA